MSNDNRTLAAITRRQGMCGPYGYGGDPGTVDWFPVWARSAGRTPPCQRRRTNATTSTRPRLSSSSSSATRADEPPPRPRRTGPGRCAPRTRTGGRAHPARAQTAKGHSDHPRDHRPSDRATIDHRAPDLQAMVSHPPRG